MKKFLIAIRSEDGGHKVFSVPLIVVDVPALRGMGQSILEHAYNLPTLIGMDFLEKNGLKLFIDVKNNIAYLED
jgi:hypothetical protein